jgi:uncharacterized BrkB/YihY/UPF0761 family membrane protein
MGDVPSSGTEERSPGGDEPTKAARRMAALQARGRASGERVKARATELQERSRLVDVGVRVYERDREAAGTLLGSALALRLFLFFVPLVLFTVGVAGIVGRYIGYDSFASDAGITGTIGDQIDAAFAQRSGSAWFMCVAGLVGMATAGYSLSRALIVSSALSWRLGGRQRSTVGIVGSVTGLIASIALLGAIVNSIRAASGLAVASASFAAVFVIYVVLWLIVFQTLPRGTTDPGASLPGALVASSVLTAMQAISTLYLPGAIERSSQLYGAIGVTLATLGWIYILGRVLAFTFSLNAAIFEQVGSVSGVVFAVPGIRAIPRRYPRIARYFDLDDSDTPTE